MNNTKEELKYVENKVLFPNESNYAVDIIIKRKIRTTRMRLNSLTIASKVDEFFRSS